MYLLGQDRLAISILEDEIHRSRYVYAKSKLFLSRRTKKAPAFGRSVEILNLCHAIARRATLSAILEYELACALEGTTWYRFVFANCLSQIIDKKSYESPIIYSTNEKAQKITISRKEFEDYSVAFIWHRLCELNFNERIISIKDNFSADIITLFIEKSTERLKLIYYSPDIEKCKTFYVPASFDANSTADTIFESVLDSL